MLCLKVPLVLLISVALSIGYSWNDAGRENSSAMTKICPSVFVSTTDVRWTDLRSSLGLQVKKLKFVCFADQV
jgi:hypothetical protein